MADYTFRIEADELSPIMKIRPFFILDLEGATLLQAEDEAYEICAALNDGDTKGWHLVSVTKNYC